MLFASNARDIVRTIIAQSESQDTKGKKSEQEIETKSIISC